MRIAVASDERTHLTDFVVLELERRGHQVELGGALTGEAMPWPLVGQWVAEQVASGHCDEGIVFCWTGTGVSIAANKVPGIRAALCADAETARGARIWNRANVLGLSLRLISEAVAGEILGAWFGTPWDEEEDAALVAYLRAIEGKYGPARDITPS